MACRWEATGSDAAASTTKKRTPPRQFWDHGKVPEKNGEDFKRLIFRNPESESETGKVHANQMFAPKDEHCGIWRSTPNLKCHASFGDRGTTASVNCYGDLIQMSQYLGVGHSGMFTMDHRSTSEPYMVRERAADLDALARSPGVFFSGSRLGLRGFWSRDPPQVKWVNWRWPRYEAITDIPHVTASSQWLVHDGIVLQQVVLKSSDFQPAIIPYEFTKDIWLRDLDYLDSDHPFNRSAEGYSCVPGPHGYGYVCVHALDRSSLVKDPNIGNIRLGKDRTTTTSGIAMSTAPPKAQPSNAKLARTVNADAAIASAPNEASPQPESECSVGDPRSFETPVEQFSNPDSIAVIINLFVNGRAAIIYGDGIHKSWFTIEPCRTVDFPCAEIVVAYKLIFLPSGEADWRNFLISAHEADVNKILREETERLWENAGPPSLCSLDLSCVEPREFSSPRTDLTNAGCDDIDNVEPEKKDTLVGHADAERGDLEDNAVISERSGAEISARKHTDPPNGARDAKSFLPNGIFASRENIEYFAWRHLEHILSVCAIPVLTPALFEGLSSGTSYHHQASEPVSWEGEGKDDVPIALTCGDMSGHRVCTSASFFAFQFLVEVAKRLLRLPCQIPYTKTLQKRINHVLRGHAKWLESLRATNQPPMAGPSTKLLRSGCFAANYWTTGQVQQSESNDLWQPMNTITDTSFHMLKLVDYIKFLRESEGIRENTERWVRDILGDFWVPWFYELHKLDKRAVFAWPHAAEDGVEKFRLADQFWIWNTLKALEDFGVSNHQKTTTNLVYKPQEYWTGEEKWLYYLYGPNALGLDRKQAYQKFDQVTMRLSPDDVQRGVLQRFTTDNVISRKKMLALTRSLRETRFLFHARDTALFYGQDRGFFLPRSSFEELWNNTIEAQPYHSENQDHGWDNALRYALGIVVGCRHLTLNKRRPEELVRRCIEVLIRSSSHNGFFPGQLDEATQEPTLFFEKEKRDSYYHAGFEINYILLNHARTINEQSKVFDMALSQRLKPATTRSSIGRGNEPNPNLPSKSQSIDVSPVTTTQPRNQKTVNEQLLHQFNTMFRQLESDRLIDGQRNSIMKKSMPFNTLVDATSVIAIEEEWLYPHPCFLSTTGVDITEQINQRISLPTSSELYREDKLKLAISEPSGDDASIIIGQELDTYRRTKREFSTPEGPRSSETTAFVVDKPKQKHRNKREKEGSELRHAVFPLNNISLFSKLTSPRTAELAKKRFIWLPHAIAETALLCWAASPAQERAAVSLFFDRHSKYEKHIWDDTTMVLNTWQTELHLSFFVMIEISAPRYVGLPPLTGDPFSGGPMGLQIRRDSMSFHFDGDFCDRYWTCHYIEHVPSKFHQAKWRFPFDSSGKNSDKQLWQRKVLELFLLDEILREIANSALKILAEVRRKLGLEESTLSFSMLDSETDSSSRDSWHKFEQVLHAVEEDLTSTLSTLQRWTSRERDRGQEQPRWTHNDERKYRSAVNKYEGSTEQQIRNLETHRDTILPLGFAASFYSMNGPPENELLISLIKFAAGALAVTIGLLASAKTLFLAVDILVVPLRRMRSKAGLAIEKFSRSTMEQSLLMKKCEKSGRCDEQENEAPPSPSRVVASGQQPIGQDVVDRGSRPQYRFWLEYIFIEIPARRLLIALFELNGGSLSPQATANIVVGIVLMPVFALSWLMKIIFLNIHDVLQLLAHIGRLFPKLSADAKPKKKIDNAAAFLRRFEQTTNPPQATRPWKIIQERVKRRSENPTISLKPEQGTESQDVACVEMDEK